MELSYAELGEEKRGRKKKKEGKRKTQIGFLTNSPFSYLAKRHRVENAYPLTKIA